jgi:hypothetical protein
MLSLEGFAVGCGTLWCDAVGLADLIRQRLILAGFEMRMPLLAGVRHTHSVAALVLLVMHCAFVLVAPVQAQAQDETAGFTTESRTGFFKYFPAPKDIKLPSLDFIPFWTDDLKRARKAYKNGDYDTALKFFRSEAESGNQVADWYLGHMYRLGQGVSRDPAISYSYYQRASDVGSTDVSDPKMLRIVVDSQLHLAEYQRTGIKSAGMPANPGEAYGTFMRIATSYGHPDANFALGVMNITGDGVAQNPQQGLKWLTAAARKRHAGSQAYLGDLYWDGKYVKKSQSRALMWYILAAETADPVENGPIVTRYQQLLASVDEDTKLEAEARARVWAEQYPASLAKSQ